MIYIYLFCLNKKFGYLALTFSITKHADKRIEEQQVIDLYQNSKSQFLATLVTQRRIQKKGFRTIHLLTSEMHKT